jgi:arginine/lysine/ornithine decarboxylase
MTVVGPGETLVVARNRHKSTFSGLILSGAKPVYVDPVYDDEFEIALGPLGSEVAAALDGHPDAKAALVFAPSYCGATADVRALAGACHERDVPLELRTEQAMVPRDAFFARTEHVEPKDAVGRISAELVTPYPPGIPVAAPGEVYNQAIVYYLEKVVAFVEGAADQSLSEFRVVAAGG